MTSHPAEGTENAERWFLDAIFRCRLLLLVLFLAVAGVVVVLRVRVFVFRLVHELFAFGCAIVAIVGGRCEQSLEQGEREQAGNEPHAQLNLTRRGILISC